MAQDDETVAAEPGPDTAPGGDGAGTATAEAAGEPGAGAAATGGTPDQGGRTGPLGGASAIRACPIPNGALIFGEMTSAFVDGPRLLKFLGDRRHTGAVVDEASRSGQVALLHEGQVLGLVSVAQGATARLESMTLPGPGDGDEHTLTVLSYRPEIVVALGQLINAPVRFERMHGSFVDLPALLRYLQRESASGAVRISTPTDVGVVLLRQGRVLGAYSRSKPDLDDPEAVFPLATHNDTEIDVHVGALQVPPPGVPVQSVVR